MSILNNSTAGRVGDSFIPAITTGELLRDDSTLWQSVFQQVDERNFLMYIESLQAWKLVEDTNIRWHEEGYVSANATIASFTGGATPGAVAVITIAASAHQNSGTRSPFRANNMIKVDGLQLFVQSKSTTTPNAHTLTVVPVPATATAASTLAAGKTMIIAGNFSAEGTGYDDGMLNIPVKFEEGTGIVKNKLNFTGTAASNKSKVKWGASNSEYMLYTADATVFKQHQIDLCMASLIGPGGTTTDASGATVRLVKGAITQVQERGNNYQYTGGIQLNDLENWTRLLLKQRAGNAHLMNVGHEADLMIERFVTDSMRQGARVYLDNNQNTVLKGNRMVDFGCDGFNLANFTFVKKRMAEFNNPISMYAPGQDYPYFVWTSPIANTKDPVTGKAGYVVQFGYKGITGPKGTSVSRKFQANVGGDGFSNELDERSFRYLTEFGVAVALANQSIVATKTA